MHCDFLEYRQGKCATSGALTEAARHQKAVSLHISKHCKILAFTEMQIQVKRKSDLFTHPN